MKPPLCIDLFCGIGGWTVGAMAAGWDCIGFDIEKHVYGADRYPAQLVLQDVLSLRGDQFSDAGLILASPPCQFFSYTAMPWTRAKERAQATRADPALLAKELELFNACFRIQAEASEAKGEHVPLIVENVRGAEPWVGRARWAWGSFLLWGSGVPALMPSPAPRSATKAPGLGHGWVHPSDPRHTPGLDFTRLAARSEEDGRKLPGFRFDGSGRSFQTASVEGMKTAGEPHTKHLTISPGRLHGKNSPKRKAASARIAKIPFPLAYWIGRAWYPSGAF